MVLWVRSDLGEELLLLGVLVHSLMGLRILKVLVHTSRVVSNLRACKVTIIVNVMVHIIGVLSSRKDWPVVRRDSSLFRIVIDHRRHLQYATALAHVGDS